MKNIFKPTITVFLATISIAMLPIAAFAQVAASAALDKCQALAGPPNSGVPGNPSLLEQSLENLSQAQPFCQTAIDGGANNAMALFHLGVAAQHAGKHDDAQVNFLAAAELGLAAAETKLGDYYLFGIGPVEADADQAVAYYNSATQQGDLGAMTTLAFMYRLGRGVPRDTSEMIRLMQAAADGGYHFAQYRLAQTYLTGDGIPGGADASLGIPDVTKALELLQDAATQGNTRAALALAQLYGDNGSNIPQDLAAHARWVEKAADTGVPMALNALGFLYEKGRGVEADPERAAALYVQALESGQVKFSDLRGRIDGRATAWDRPTAIAFQVILKDRGLYRGAIDGQIGPLSTAAAKALDD